MNPSFIDELLASAVLTGMKDDVYLVTREGILHPSRSGFSYMRSNVNLSISFLTNDKRLRVALIFFMINRYVEPARSGSLSKDSAEYQLVVAPELTVRVAHSSTEAGYAIIEDFKRQFADFGFEYKDAEARNVSVQ